jgi:hypothetical protein
MSTQTPEQTGQLPPVDPDFRIVERNAANLHAYASGLLQHLLRIRAGQKSQGYPIATIRSASVWLIESYAEAGVAPSPDAARLVDEIVKSNRGASTLPVRASSKDAYWAAIQFEAGKPPDPKGKRPSAATLYAVAKHVRPRLQNRHASQKTAEATVRDWRQLGHYRDNVALQRPHRVRT